MWVEQLRGGGEREGGRGGKREGRGGEREREGGGEGKEERGWYEGIQPLVSCSIIFKVTKKSTLEQTFVIEYLRDSPWQQLCVCVCVRERERGRERRGRTGRGEGEGEGEGERGRGKGEGEREYIQRLLRGAMALKGPPPPYDPIR